MQDCSQMPLTHQILSSVSPACNNSNTHTQHKPKSVSSVSCHSTLIISIQQPTHTSKSRHLAFLLTLAYKLIVFGACSLCPLGQTTPSKTVRRRNPSPFSIPSITSSQASVRDSHFECQLSWNYNQMNWWGWLGKVHQHRQVMQSQQTETVGRWQGQTVPSDTCVSDQDHTQWVVSDYSA